MSDGLLAWISLLAGLACAAFGSSCTVIRLLGGDSVWCPGNEEEGEPAAGLALAGLLCIATAVVMFQRQDSNNDGGVVGGTFALVRLRLLGLAMAWLGSNRGAFYVVFLLLAVQCAARAGNKFLLISSGVNQRLPAAVVSTLSLVLVLEALLCAYYGQVGLFLMCYLVLAFLFEGEAEGDESGDEGDSLTPLDAFLALLLVGVVYFATAGVVPLQLLALLECITWPVFTEHLAHRRMQRAKYPVADTRLAFASILHQLQQPQGGGGDAALALHALPVMCATALVNSAKSSSLSPSVLVCHLLFSSSSSSWVSALGVVVAMCGLPLAREIGPRAANRVHLATDSLLKTGLVLFWATALATLPLLVLGVPRPAAITVVVLGLVLVLIVFSGAFEALQMVQAKIAQEWNGEQRLAKEQLVLNSAALFVSSLACAAVASTTTTTRTDSSLAVANAFAVFSCTLGAAAYTAWYAQFGRGGAFRIIDEEGRELLSVTG